MTLTPEQQTLRAQQILEDEVFQDVLRELEVRAVRAVKDAPTIDALVAARAQLVALADIPSALGAIRDRQFIKARPEKRSPLA